jgi:hypothetical protein
MIRLPMLGLATLVLAAGCTWVHMAPGASAVQVIGAGGPPAGCVKRGDIAVSVKDSVAFYERNNLRVREELETLARNEAPGLEADTIQPLGAPLAGEQRFAAYHCGSVRPAAGPGVPDAPKGTVQTYPVGG